MDNFNFNVCKKRVLHASDISDFYFTLLFAYNKWVRKIRTYVLSRKKNKNQTMSLNHVTLGNA